MPEASQVALIVGVFLLAGLVKGTTGIGLPTASVGMMSQVMDPRAAIALVVFPSLLSNAWQMWRSRMIGATVRRFRIFLVCLMGTIAAVSVTLTAAVRTDVLMVVLGAVIVFFSVSSLAWAPPYLAERHDRAGQLVAGVASGVLGGLTAIWAPTMVAYLMARRVDKEAFVAATGVMIFAGTIPLIGGLWQNGLITGPSAILSLAMTAPAIAGFAVGERLRRDLDAKRFRTVVLAVFLVMGLNLIRKALV